MLPLLAKYILSLSNSKAELCLIIAINQSKSLKSLSNPLRTLTVALITSMIVRLI